MTKQRQAPSAGHGPIENGVAVSEEAPPGPPPSLADKIDRLFRVVRPAGTDREYTYREVADGVADRGAPPISDNYLYMLRSGRRDNPGKKLLEALAGFFGTSVTYFYDEPGTDELDDELRLVAALRNSSIRELALRSVNLSTGNLRHLLGIVEQVREMERLPERARPRVEEWSEEGPAEPED